MQRGLVHGLAWSLATGAAVTLSWWGVHTVMAGTAYDRPRALPISAEAARKTPAPLSSATQRPETSASPDKSGEPPTTPDGKPSGRPSRGASNSTPPSGPGTSGSGSGSGSGPGSGSASAGNVKGYTVDGGRVVFDLGDTSAELVSATPSAGWQMQVWKQPTWIRVTFTRDGRELSVFCTWHDHPPLVETYER
ncbi:hypothetical protein NLX86_15985 [Streptomyces sp. A3M-1-3]|uniref:hypothetical protein n=1 Tax=Streptomyces sp. A3M-1-3 TaxID=2962044 RepID=UPI0020B71FBA|nr:hypothetical protein [Streptomyces sp. A3M-1-3]MCP3819547.1 hypothetical protein [Streptomyces sp. A3M-1-3]